MAKRRRTNLMKDMAAADNVKQRADISELYELFPMFEELLETEVYTERDHLSRGQSRRIQLANGEHVYIRECYGFSDRTCLNIEYLHNTKTGRLGHILNPKYDIDYIAYIHLAEGVIYIFDYWALRALWMAHETDWLRDFVTKRTPNGEYETLCLEVKASFLMPLLPGKCWARKFDAMPKALRAAYKGHKLPPPPREPDSFSLFPDEQYGQD